MSSGSNGSDKPSFLDHFDTPPQQLLHGHVGSTDDPTFLPHSDQDRHQSNYHNSFLNGNLEFVSTFDAGDDDNDDCDDSEQ